jgi:hypothetical protein
MRAPLLVAFAVLVCAHALWLAFAHAAEQGTTSAGALPWLAVPIAGFVAAVLAKQRQVVVALSVAVLAAVFFVGSNALYAQLGHRVDFPGLKGALFVFGMSFPICCLLVAAGAGLARLSPFRPV